MKFITAFSTLLLFFTVTTSASAQTYGYIDTAGVLQIVTADSAEIALTTAENIAHDSGVMVMSAKGLALINSANTSPLASSQTDEAAD